MAPSKKAAEPDVESDLEFDGYDVTRFTLKINAKELPIDDTPHYGKYVTATVRGRIGKVTHEPAADGTLARVGHLALGSVKITSVSDSVDPNQLGLFGGKESPEPEAGGE